MSVIRGVCVCGGYGGILRCVPGSSDSGLGLGQTHVRVNLSFIPPQCQK